MASRASCRVTTGPTHGPDSPAATPAQLGGPPLHVPTRYRPSARASRSGGQRWRSVARQFHRYLRPTDRSTDAGALLQRISVPPGTPCVAASSSASNTLRVAETPRRSAIIMVSPFSGQSVGWISLITRYACAAAIIAGHSSSCRGSPARPPKESGTPKVKVRKKNDFTVSAVEAHN